MKNNGIFSQKSFSIVLWGIKVSLKNPFYQIWKKSYLKQQICIQDSYELSSISSSKNIVAFVLPSIEIISGGILSIFSLYKYTKRLLPDFSTLLITENGKDIYAKISWFENDEKIYRWEQFINNIQNTENLILHISEYMADKFYAGLSSQDIGILQNIKNLRINILNQNPQLLPEISKLQKLFLLSSHITQTLAFKEKDLQNRANRYFMPLSFISSYVDLSKWRSIPFNKKEKLILLSSDKNKYRKEIVRILKKQLPEFNIITIKQMSFETYMNFVCKATAVISFGEGYDGYFLQPCYVGTLSFAVYNETFFPNSSFLDLEHVYPSYKAMSRDLVQDIIKLTNNSEEYYGTINKLKILDKDHSEEVVVRSLERFYQQKYDVVPEKENF